LSEIPKFEQTQSEREAHRAIGRYVAEFSWLVAVMRSAIERQITQDDPMVARLAVGQSYADSLSNSFFAICERIADFDDEERGVATRLKNEVRKAIEDRNDFAHGDWELEFEEPTLARTKPGRKAGAWFARVRPVAEMDEMSDALRYLAGTLNEFAWLCENRHPGNEAGKSIRVRDIYRLRKSQVLRVGRYADDWPIWD